MGRVPQIEHTVASAGSPAPMPVAVRRHPLVGEVARRLRFRCGVPPGATVVVGVSGGADSLALLLAATALSGRSSEPGGALLRPVAVHVNHHLRDSADRDARYVAEVCDRYAVPLHCRDVYPQRLEGNVQANARRLRYDALTEVAASVGANHVAVAHHAEDQLETLLMALGRGAGVDGLSGMGWCRPLAGSMSLVRPMLSVRRSACRELCRLADLPWRDDPTNADPRSVRGRLRRDVLEVFEALWPGAAGRATGIAESIATARQALERELQATFGDPSQRQWDRAALRVLPAPVIAAGLRRAAMNAVPGAADDIGQAHLLPAAEAVTDADRSPRRFDWPHGLHVEMTARSVRLLGLRRSSPARPCTAAAPPAPSPTRPRSDAPRGSE